MTDSADYPTTPEAFDTTFNGGGDAFVTKLDSAGSTLLYSTYLGGAAPDNGRAIAVDSAGDAYVTGVTGSADYPTTPGAFDTTYNGGFDAFVTRIEPRGDDAEGCKVTLGGRITAANGDNATFGGNAQSSGLASTGSEEYQDHGPAQPMNLHSSQVLAVVCSAELTAADIFGVATIDGMGAFLYRIRVQDLGEPGTSDTYWITVSNGYDSGQQTLESGNVQIHKSSSALSD